MKRLFSLFALTAILSVIALADVRLPDTPTPKPLPKGKQMEMFIDVTSEVDEPTLVIKKSSAKRLRAALDEAENSDNSTASVEAKPNLGSVQTVIAGTFLSLALVFGGVWLVRSKPSRTTIGLFLILILGSSSLLVLANVAPPRVFGISKNVFSDEIQRRAFVRGKVRIKIVNDSIGDDIKLLVPSDE